MRPLFRTWCRHVISAQPGRLLAALGLLLATAASAQISVNSSGQASTGLEIAVPPGISGMAPNLSLSYSDGGINGPVGMGWSVQGISVITRCPATRQLDGVARSVMFNKNDKLCLDGQRLIRTNAAGEPSPAATGSPARLSGQIDDAIGDNSATVHHREFRTEKDSYSRIRAYGRAYGSATADNQFGPARFVVWTKSGLKYEYGRLGASDNNALIFAEGSNFAVVWAVRRISDVYGNYMLFEYEQRLVTDWGSRTSDPVSANGTEWNLKQVHYTGRFNLSDPNTIVNQPVNRVEFVYEDRVASPSANQSHDRAEAYQFNSKNVSIQRLSAIRTYVGSSGGAGGTLAKHYKLAYTLSARTGRSLLQSVSECSDAAGSLCLPPTTFAYRSIDAPAFVERASFSLKNVLLLDSNNQAGVLTGDFNGDGRTDILRYHDTPANNILYESDGTGNFTARTSNITSQQLFHSNRCYHSMVADFNGDGLSDILRIVAKNEPGCHAATGSNLLLLSAPSGTTRNFTAVTVPAEAKLERIRSTTIYGDPTPCSNINRTPAVQAKFAEEEQREVAPLDTWFDGAPELAAESPSSAAPMAVFCYPMTQSIGNAYYVIDVDGDGVLDIVTAAYPDMMWSFSGSPPSVDAICEGRPSAINANSSMFGGPCTRVFKGSVTGNFTEISTPVAYKVLYRAPPVPVWNSNPYWILPDLVDVNGDGLMDIRADNGTWRSLGDGDFTTSGIGGVTGACSLPIDFNGDGRVDCLYPSSSSASQYLRVAYGASWSNPLTTFNLASTPFTANDGQGRQTVGVVVEDFDGDGRQDILRWSSTSSGNEIYLSRGDGSFRAVGGANLQNMQIQRADGGRAFVLGDFMGNGTVQILRMAANPPAGLAGAVIDINCYSLNCNDPPPPPAGITDTVYNMMLVRQGQIGPVDVLTSVTSPTGLTSSVVNRASLTRGLDPDPLALSGYAHDTGGPVEDTLNKTAVLNVQPPMYVITATSRDTGNGTLTTHYRYVGLKAERGGRGMLGFRQMQQRDTTPAGTDMTVVTDYLHQHPYLGVASRTRTFLGGFGDDANLSTREGGSPPVGERRISLTENTYCEFSVAASQSSATFTAPCATTALLTRPYLAKTVERGWDLNGAALPVVTTTNTYNLYGDPTQIVVKTEAVVAGTNREYTKTTTNTFCAPDAATCAGVTGASPNKIAGDNWILGRLSKATARSQAQNYTLSAGAGSATNATAIKGAPPPGTPMAINPAVLQLIVDMILGD